MDGGLEDESALEGAAGRGLIRGISMLIHNFLTFADHRVCEEEEEEEESRGGEFQQKEEEEKQIIQTLVVYFVFVGE